MKVDNKSIKIIGYGWVGKAVHSLFPDALIHDPDNGFVSNQKTDISFICVPTPNREDGSLDTSIVEKVARECRSKLIVVRSTVMPGTCDRIGENACFQPEFLGETVSHPLLNEGERNFLIIGGRPEYRRKLIELYQTVYNANTTIRQMTNYEAEVVKLSENRAIAFKVAECQELYDVCEKAGIDYYAIREAVYKDDPRFNLWWTFIYPEKRGFNSKCIPKDIYGWAAWAESVGYYPYITKAILEKNELWLKSNFLV